MKKIVQFILSSVLVIAAVGCTNKNNNNSGNNSDNSQNSSENPSSHTPGVNTYNIKFVNYDETLLQEMTVDEGVTPVYSGETPTKEQTEEFTYTFSDWTPQIVAAHADATYTATYQESKRQYTITFNNDDGTLISSSLVDYGVIPTPPSDPSKDPTARYEYTFSGWDKEIVAVTKDETYTATYSREIRQYLITFVDEDETVLKSERYDYGETPTCDAPSKAPTNHMVYEFAGWSPEVVPVVADATYTATYSERLEQFLITFVDDDDTVIKTQMYDYGATPTCEEPSKDPTDEYSYEFSGWTPEIVPVVGEATYKATYEATERKYQIKFVDEEGNEIDVQNLTFGTMPTEPNTDKADDAEFSYTFTGWDKEIVAVDGDATYTASYSKTRIAYNFDPEKPESYVGASLYAIDKDEDQTWVMAENRGGYLTGTEGTYLQYQAYEADVYKISLPKIDFRHFKTLSSSIKLLDYSANKMAIAFSEEDARAGSGMNLYGSYETGRIEIISRSENSIEVMLNTVPDGSTKISHTFTDEDIYKGDKSIEIYIDNSVGGDKYITIENFAPRTDYRYIIDKARVIRVNDCSSWAACFFQMVIGQTFLPNGPYVYSNVEDIKLYRDDELVTTATIANGEDAADAFNFDGMHFRFGSGGNGASGNWMARVLKDGCWDCGEIIENNDILAMNGAFVGKTGTAAAGYEIGINLRAKITVTPGGYQGTHPGYTFTLL